jgi:hypothetical protein
MGKTAMPRESNFNQRRKESMMIRVEITTGPTVLAAETCLGWDAAFDWVDQWMLMHAPWHMPHNWNRMSHEERIAATKDCGTFGILYSQPAPRNLVAA